MKSKTMLNHKFVKVLTSLLIYIINCFLIYSVLKMHFNSFKLYAFLLVGIVFFVTFVVSFISKTNCIHLFISYIIMIMIIYTFNLRPTRGLDGAALIMQLFMVFMSELFGSAFALIIRYELHNKKRNNKNKWTQPRILQISRQQSTQQLHF